MDKLYLHMLLKKDLSGRIMRQQSLEEKRLNSGDLSFLT